MECGTGDFVCEFFRFKTLIDPHLPWIGALFGIAMAIWKWWDGREVVLYRRANRRLDERNNQVRIAVENTLNTISIPTPMRNPAPPLFIVPALRRVLSQQWRPLFRFTDPLRFATLQLEDTHRDLAEKYTTIRKQKSFVVEQRYSAFLLQGAIAAAQATDAKGQDKSRLENDALQKFDAALGVDGKKSDPQALELKGLQLRKLNRHAEANASFAMIEGSLVTVLQGAAPLDDAERTKFVMVRLRNARYRAEINHMSGANGIANNLLNAIVTDHAHLFSQSLVLRALLERGQFHEVHGCVRAKLFAVNGVLPANGVAQQSIAKAKRDYSELLDQVDQRHFAWLRRLWRICVSAGSRDGTDALRLSAKCGLKRLAKIEICEGCGVCSK